MIKRLALAGFTLAYVGLIAAADDSQPSAEELSASELTNKSGVRKDSSNVVASARQAEIDPKTGQLTSDVQRQNLPSSSVVQNDIALPPVEIKTLSDGTVQAKLNGRFRTPLRATIGCNGGITTGHSDKPLESSAQCAEDN